MIETTLMTAHVRFFIYITGWVKTYEDYYNQQTKHILDLALKKLQQYPDLKFIYAEISFFHMWWNEQSEANRDAVKK